jgi:hypothetical protein
MAVAGIVVEDYLTAFRERIDDCWIPEINGASDVIE